MSPAAYTKRLRIARRRLLAIQRAIDALFMPEEYARVRRWVDIYGHALERLTQRAGSES
jgi:hypothetical protein